MRKPLHLKHSTKRHPTAQLLVPTVPGGMLAGTSVDALVENWRKQLGMMTWRDLELLRRSKAERQRSMGYSVDPTRATGRTTRGMLEALAKCMQLGIHHVVVDTRGEMHTAWLVAHMKGLVAQLNLSITVWTRGHQPRQSGYITYADHFVPPPK